METVIFIGIQASGKSTFYKEKFFQTHIRINLDMLKTRHREKVLTKACLDAKQAFVIDNTNPTVEDRLRYITLAKKYEFTVTGYYFEPNFAESVEWNRTRSETERVPLIGIKSTIKKLEAPNYAEGFDSLFRVSIQNNKFVISHISE